MILWSLSNEEKEQGNELGAKQARAMVNTIRNQMQTRPTTHTMNNSIGHGLTELIDVQGFNYHPETYDQTLHLPNFIKASDRDGNRGRRRHAWNL